MPDYSLGHLPYAARGDVLGAIDDAVAALKLPTVNPTLDGACTVIVRVTTPPERIGTHTPEPEAT